MPAMTQADPRNRIRVFLGIIGLSLLVLLGVGVGASWRLEKRVWDVGVELIAGARAIEASRWPRPSHVDNPIPGTFGQALAPLLPELRRFHTTEPRLTPEVNSLCVDVREGRRPVSELPPACRDWLASSQTLREHVLKTSRTEEAGLPEGLRAIDPLPDDTHDTGLMSLLSLLRAAALEVRLDTDGGQPEKALEICLDALALARDLGHGASMFGTSFSIGGQRIMFRPCAATLQALPVETLPRAASALRRLREGMSPFSSAMRQESIQGILCTVGRALDPRQLEQLPAAARALVKRSSPPPDLSWKLPVLTPIFMRMALLETFRYDQRMVPLMDLPIELRASRIEEVAHELGGSWNPIHGEGNPLVSAEAFARRVDQQRAMLDLLLALAEVRMYRAEHGQWPDDVPPLHPERPVLLPTALLIEPGQEGAITILAVEVILDALKTGTTSAEMARFPFEVKVRP